MIEVTKRIVVMLACALVVVACKSNSISSGTTTGSNVIGPNGGVVTLADGAEVRIPAGALTKDTTITVAVAGPSEYPSAGLYTFASKVYSFTPHGLKFNTAVVIDIPFTPTTDLVALHADPGGQWAPVTAMIGATSAEVSATSFSLYAVASTTTAGDASASCSGRGPDNGAPTGMVSMGMGSVDPGQGAPLIAFSALVDGYAISSSGPPTVFEACVDGGTAYTLGIALTPYAGACGHFRNGVSKIGTSTAYVSIASSAPITARTYNFRAEVGFGAGGIPSSAPPGSCGGGASGSGGGTCAGPPAVTITAIDATHVAGRFNFDPGRGAGTISGTFDVPFCAQNAGLNPYECCVP